MPLHLRSPYWTKNDEQLKNAGPKDKLISDYVFVNPTGKHPLRCKTHFITYSIISILVLTILIIYIYTFANEQLFGHGAYYLNRDQFQTLRNGELESVFLDIWCLRLNHLDLSRGVDKPKRILFLTQVFVSNPRYCFYIMNVFYE